MPDTYRQLAALQALFGDNVTRQISPQDLRDFLVSALPTGRAPTKTIAPNSASDFLKAQADYVCDGVSDEVQINEALTALIPTGGVVHLFPGDFSIDMATQTTDSGVIHIPADNIMLQGSGRATNIQSATSRQGATDRYMIGMLGPSDYGRVGWGVRDLRITCKDAAEHALRVIGSGGGLVENVWFIHDNSIATSTDEGIQYWDQIAAGGVSRSNQGDVLRGLWIQGFGGSANAGIEFAVNNNNTRDIIFSDSWIVSCGLGAKFRGAGTGTPRRLNLSRIRVITPTASGFTLGTLRESTFSQCYVFDGGTHGWSFSGAAANLNYLSFDECGAEECDSRGWDINGTGHRFANCFAKNNGQNAGLTATNRAGVSLQTGAARCFFSGFVSFDNQGTVTQQRGFIENSNPSNNYYQGCDANGNVTNWSLGTSYDKVRTRANVGYVTEAKGTGTIANGATSAVITHGLDVTPTLGDIAVTLGENPTNTPGAIWVDTITATQFTVNCENDPGASGLDFAWHIISL